MIQAHNRCQRRNVYINNNNNERSASRGDNDTTASKK